MRTKLLKIVVVLLLAGSGDSRPQNVEEPQKSESTQSNTVGWKAVEPHNDSHDVRRDTRYTRNSGSNRISYNNYYPINKNPLIERPAEVSLGSNEPDRLKDVDLHNSKSNKENDSESRINTKLTTNNSDESKYSGDLIKVKGNSNEFNEQNPTRISKILHERVSESSKNNLIKDHRGSGNLFSGYHRIPLTREITSDNARSNRMFFNLRKSERKSNSPYKSDRRTLYPRFPEFRKSTNRIGLAEGDSFSDSSNVRAKPSGRTDENDLNNSESTVLALSRNSDSEFSGYETKSSNDVREIAMDVKDNLKVESSTQFDQIEAIRRITHMLQTQKNESSKSLSTESKNNPKIVDSDPVKSDVFANRNVNQSNRKLNSKHANRRRFRFSSSIRNSASRRGVKPNIIYGSQNNYPIRKTHFKNWPNEAVQTTEDLYNYDKYTSLEDAANLDSQFHDVRRRPVSMKNSSVDFDPPTKNSMQEIIHWLRIPPFTNQSHFVENKELDGPISVVFDPIYQNLQPNQPSNTDSESSNPESYSQHDTVLSESNYPIESSVSEAQSGLQNVPLKDKTSFSPITQVSQNTVVQVLSSNLKKPNVTNMGVDVLEMKPFSNETFSSSSNSGSSSSSSVSSSSSSSSSGPNQGPNVHIAFTSQEQKDKKPNDTDTQAPMVTYDESCPTIMINSYTRVNNTIQSKEGCTDLNIIINSHVFNTNVFKPSADSLSDQQTQSANVENYNESDKYINGDQGDSYSNYETIPSQTYNTNSVSSDSPQSSVYYDPQKDPQENIFETAAPTADPEFHVFQDTEVIVDLTSQNEPIDSVSQDPSSPVENPVQPLSEESDVTENVQNPSVDEVEPSIIEEASSGPADSSISDLTAESSLSNSEIATGQGNGGLPSTSLQLPASSNLPNSGSLSNPSTSLSPGSSTAQGSPPAVVSGSSDDDDDDDDFDLSPDNMMESVTSIFTYFTFLHPLNYGFFSLAAAPFAALAAGVIGISAFLFPWAFPSVFDFGRASDKVSIRFRPNIEEVVRQSMYKYGRLNEWKSKRKKRKR